MTTFARSRALADRLLEKYGADAVLSHVTPGTTAADLSGRTGDTTATTNTKVVTLAFRYQDIDGTRIVAGDVRGLVKSNVDPQVGDVLTVNGTDVYRVISAKPLYPKDETLLTEVQLRV